MARVRRPLVAVASALLLAIAGCTPEPPPDPEPPPTTTPSASPDVTLPPVGVDCRELATQGLTLHLTNAADLSIAAVEYGSGPKGVVLAHQSDANMCQWLRYAIVLAEQGYRVVAFDFAGFGASSPTDSKTYLEDIRTAVTYLRERGTPRVAVIGASMGATMSIVAAAAITPPLDAVVAISPPSTFDGVNAERAAVELKSPALYIAGESDGDYEVYAEEINEATPESLRSLLVVDSPEHGVKLVEAGTAAGAEVRAAIRSFLAQHLNPSPTTSTTK
ncbi:alpha/beta fold hydrolase [Kyrpidia sp.]|uniref:alpha/beta hydrolase family protein n=1 Tax=Kyrpidia sp. TaxID=2073077 RepID=UPI002588424C|nr:alpha/beta fold hydrolase [Kyrpidia sp.]MCL6577275.1 alpha/beta hydrolase [Kyrpidia sp.]